MSMKNRRMNREWFLLLLFLATLAGLVLWALWQSQGTLTYHDWHLVEETIEGKTRMHAYYQYLTRDLFPTLPLLACIIGLGTAALVAYGLRKRRDLAAFAVCFGFLVFCSVFFQAFFEGYRKHLITLAAGLFLMFLTAALTRRRPGSCCSAPPGMSLREMYDQGKALLHTLPGGLKTKKISKDSITLPRVLMAAILLLLVLNLLFGVRINGARAWVYLGPIHFQPGEMLKPMLVLLAACSFPARRVRASDVLPFFLVNALSILVLISIRDLGNAAILFCLLLVSLWYLTDLDALAIGLALSAFLALYTILLVREDLLHRFNSFRALAQGEGQQYDALMALLHSGLQGSGVGPEGNYLWSTVVSHAQTDLISLLPLSILGLGGMVLVLLALSGILLGPMWTPAASPFHTVLHGSSCAVLFVQAALNLGGALNVLPFTGVCFPLLSAGGSSMLSTGVLFGFCLSALLWGNQTAAPKARRLGQKGWFPK